MKGLNKIFVSILIFANITGCNRIVKPEADPTPVVTPSPTPPNVYNPNLKVTENNQCSFTNKTLYEIKEDGTFYYSYIERNVEKSESVKLSENEFNRVKELLNTLDIYNLAKNNTVNTANFTQKEDCQSVENYIFNVNGTETLLDYNSEKINYSSEYKNAIEAIKTFLLELKNNQHTQIFPYDLPLKVTSYDECNKNPTEKLVYQITENGGFAYSENSNADVEYKRLTMEQVSQLRFLLDDLNLAKLAEQDILYSRDNVSSSECRLINYYYINYNGKERVFGRNDRIAQHSATYLSNLDNLESKLQELKRVAKN